VKERLGKFPHVRAAQADVHALPFGDAEFDTVLVFHTLTYAEHPARALEQCARVLRPGGRLVLLCLDRHEQREVTARYGELHPGFSPRSVRGLLRGAGLEVVQAEVACRDAKKPHLQVVLAIADKPREIPAGHGKTQTRRRRKTAG
jgi:ArsR family transcriptional regulator